MSFTFDDMVEITLPDEEAFLKVKETLTRIGIASKKEPVLYQSCHILHKKGRYAIAHFKEMFLLDGKPSDLSENDIARRNTIINLLEEWGLIDIVNKAKTKDPVVPINQIKILPFKEKSQWELREKYQVGKKRT